MYKDAVTISGIDQKILAQFAYRPVREFIEKSLEMHAKWHMIGESDAEITKLIQSH